MEAVAEVVQQSLAAELEAGEPVRLWLAGLGDSAWQSELGDRLALECQTLDPFRYIDCAVFAEQDGALLERAGEFAVAAGLACRGLTGA